MRKAGLLVGLSIIITSTLAAHFGASADITTNYEYINEYTTVIHHGDCEKVVVNTGSNSNDYDMELILPGFVPRYFTLVPGEYQYVKCSQT